ncbi:sensor histidine kinase [Zunongwangia pacifica]|uniref:Histidine kinase n=1 Tax=Zunongwangia pacifica TaxID=2911062 RepID=A0A9X1ZUK0_9FLAO|nr:histidine kinase [Zunongwangia pacifica]MCL6220224.1 histidine kinase [Zunongwangia pacifica]
MTFNFTEKKWLAIKLIIVLSVLLPVSIVTYQIVFSGKDSVILLEDYPTPVSFIILIYYLILLILGILWLLIQLKSIINLKNEKKKNELLHLQNQVNPHFFFNMLNNLYGVVGKDTIKAKNLILKLSDLMRYSIYRGAKNEVRIKEEISYLQSFIELNKIRYHKEIDIRFEIEVDNEDEKIMPLIFIALMENAFKHGVENLREKSFVYCHLRALKGEIIFEISNNFDKQGSNEKPGIGIKNLKRRLEIAYPNKHIFKITQKETVFTAFLKIRK